MAITKMSLVKINGNVKYIDETMIKCCDFGMFHIEKASQLEEYEKSNDKFLEYSPKTGYLREIVDLAGKLGLGLFSDQIPDLDKFKDSDKIGEEDLTDPEFLDQAEAVYNNPYKNLLKNCEEIFAKLSIKPSEEGYEDLNLSIDQMSDYIEDIKTKIISLFEQKDKQNKQISDYRSVLTQLENIDNANIDFDELFSCKHLKIRFGRLPKESYEKLKMLDKDNVMFFSFKVDSNYSWCLYITPIDGYKGVDQIFRSLFFERIRIPIYAHGTPESAKRYVSSQIQKYQDMVKYIDEELVNIKKEVKEKLCKIFSKVRFFSQCFDNKKYVAVFKDQFYIIGFIPKSKEHKFVNQFRALKEVDITINDPVSEKRIKTPVKLKNNRFSQPFQEFVAMYGLPDYQNMDPTMFLSVIYTVLFGVMFGDIGHGLVIALLGFIWSKIKKSNFPRILTRIGLSSAFFGVIYGSCFGFEDLFEEYIAGFPAPYRDLLLKVSHKETSVLLLGAIFVGVIAIIGAMIFNIISGIKQKKSSIYLFGPNGVSGVMCYVSIIIAIVCTVFLKIDILSPWFVICFVVLPFLLIWVKEPLGDKIDGREIHFEDGIGSFLMENFFELYDVILGFITNTISFVRVGAFVLSHAGMMMVIMSFMTNMSTMGKGLVFVIGNIFVIAFEGLIVGIQALRLQFYEIFSRCFDGSGKPFDNI